MACVVCEHCHNPVAPYETFKVRQGYSYHEKCIKCYVCSETNLRNADVFKGVIFCSSCSHRIFQGCSTAKRTKNTDKKPRDRSHKRRSHRTKGRRTPTHDGILELTTYAMSTDSTSHGSDQYKSTIRRKSSSTLPRDHAQTIKVDIEKSYSMKKFSVEMGMTTEVTQELLKQMNCPVVAECMQQVPPSKPQTKPTERKKKQDCSDLRIFGLGTSTEIANLALRNKSEKPVIIKSQHKMGKLESLSDSGSIQDSDESGRPDEMDSAYSSLDSTRTHCVLDRRLGSILKLPYKIFKRHILDRSSLISVLITREHECSLKQRIKAAFHEEITDHQKRGLRRLYSTVNRKKKPNTLGWLSNTGTVTQSKRCKHFKESHSYRCMRAHVMKLAGPTASELATFRNKVRNIVAPGFMTKACVAITMSQGCGNSVTTKV